MKPTPLKEKKKTEEEESNSKLEFDIASEFTFPFFLIRY